MDRPEAQSWRFMLGVLCAAAKIIGQGRECKERGGGGLGTGLRTLVHKDHRGSYMGDKAYVNREVARKPGHVIPRKRKEEPVPRRREKLPV